MRIASTGLFLLAAIVNLAPMSGAFSVSRMEALYGIPLEGSNLEILLRHRAILLGIVGALLFGATIHPPLRMTALAAGLVSMLSFVVVAYVVGDYNTDLQRVARIDVLASGLLLLGGVFHRMAP